MTTDLAAIPPPPGIRWRELLPLWVGVLGPPLLWALRIGATYLLIPYACWWDATWTLHATSVLALLATGAAGFLAYRAWTRVGRGTEVDRGGTRARTRFMSLFGMASAAFFFVVIVGESMPNLVVDPCQWAGDRLEVASRGPGGVS